MKELKTHKGITLVALIITIVVLLILATAGIGAVRDSKIIAHAQNAGDSYTIGKEKEQIGLAVSEWQLEKVIPGNNVIFKNVIENALQGQDVRVDGEENGPLTITFNKTGNQYMVETDGTITPVIPEESNPNDPVNPEEPKDPEEVVTVGVKAYRFGTQISLITPDNEMALFLNETELLPAYTVRLTEDVSGYNITFSGFTDEEKSKIKLLTGDGFELGAIVAYIGDDRNIAYMGMITEGSTDVEISKSVYIEHSDELLAKYYQDEPNVEYYYGKFDTYQTSNTTVTGMERLFKIDYNNNTITLYGKIGEESSWSKATESTILNKGTNTTEINVIVDENPVTITKNALKLDYKLYETINMTLYIQDGILYWGQISEGAKLYSGDHTQFLVKYINTSVLPQ